jgi:hypothetical protein
MACDVQAVLLQGLFPLKSTLTITRSLNTSLTPGGAGALTSSGLTNEDGKVWAQLWYDGVEQFYCQAEECAQAVKAGAGAVNGSIWTCPTLECTCRPGTTFCGGGTAVRAVFPLPSCRY